MERNTVPQAMGGHVAARQRQRTGREIDCIDPGAREDQRCQDGEAARAGAEIEHATHARGIGDRQGAAHQEIADEGARDQGAAVDVETHAVHVGGTHQVRRRQAQRHAGVDQGEEARAFGGGGPEVEPGIEGVDRQAQRLQHQESRLVDGIGGAVAVGEAGGPEAADREPEEVAQGDERGFGGTGHASLDYLT